MALLARACRSLCSGAFLPRRQRHTGTASQEEKKDTNTHKEGGGKDRDMYWEAGRLNKSCKTHKQGERQEEEETELCIDVGKMQVE